MAAKSYLGFDPGKSGAVAAIDADGNVLRLVIYSPADYVATVAEFAAKGCFAAVEHVGAMPGQGVTSCFSFGENFGFIKGILETHGVPYELVRPRKWKGEFSCTSDKNTSIAVAGRLFPTADLRRTPRCVKPHDGLAEALLLAEWARRRHMRMGD